MRRYRPYLIAGGGVWAAFLAVQLGAVALAEPLVASGVSVGGDPSDPRVGVAFVLGLLAATAVLYGAFRFGLQLLIRGLMFVVTVGLTIFVFSIGFPSVVTIASVNVVAVLTALALGVATFRRDDWWLIDVQAIVVGIGIVALFGTSFGIRPILVLLVLLAVYDAISVYGTEHMVTLAEDAVATGLPVLLVVPYGGGEAGTDEEGVEDGAPGPWAEAMYIGLGDAAIPSILIVSAAVHGPTGTVGGAGLPLTVPAIGAMIGISAGLWALLTLTASGRPHAGLPLLNTGAIGGYLLGAVLAGIPLLEAIGVPGVA